MIKSTHTILTSAMALMVFVAYGQRGPGGVTDDLDNQKNCRLWLDASTLNQADATNVELWEDKSISDVVDNAFWDDGQNYAPPEFRSDPAAGINGKPTISFENGGMLSIGNWPDEDSSFDLNQNVDVITTYEQSIFGAFRTGSDVSSRQIIWEEGGSSRGFIVYILNQTIRIGAYDDINDDDPPTGGGGGSNVPKFGFTWKELPVQANTTYVLSFVYDVPTGAHNNVAITNNSNPAPILYSGLTGTLNGQPFPPNMLWGTQEGVEPAVGGVFFHPDPVGIGGLNRTSYNENGPVGTNVATGSFGFTGRISEICYYAYAVSPCQRIIIENYLAAKYFSNVIASDKYVYESGYGEGVIGIGKEGSALTDFHNVSQGDNMFEFSASNFSNVFNTTASAYILAGHNNNPITWTDDNVPNTISIQRLRRVWRWDFSGTSDFRSASPELKLKIDQADLPVLPLGYSEYGVMIERSNGLLPNFNDINSEIVGLNLESGRYEADVVIKDGTHLTIVAIKPQVQFTQATTFSVEGDSPPPTQPGETLYARLNFEPDPLKTYTATVSLEDDNAYYGSDYTASGTTINLNFAGGIREIPIPITIVNDNAQLGDEAIERFFAVITNVSSNLTIGQQDTLRYRILDNDPPPKASFQSNNISFNEVDGIYSVPVEIIGTFTGEPQVEVKLKSGVRTATEGIDFSIVSPQELTFSPGSQTQNVQFTIIDDDIDISTPYDEFDEWFKLEITDASTGIGFDASGDIEITVNINDADPEPTVQFQAQTSESYEAVSDPRIYLELSAPSAKLISIPFQITGGSATNGSGGDYDASSSSTLILQPGETEGYIYFDIPSGQTRLYIYADGLAESPEDIEFELSDSPGPSNAQLGDQSTHVLTIRDYEPFQNNGVAGVAKLNDNTFWMVADQAITGNPTSVPNLSPRPISIIQNTSSRRPTVVENILNDKKVLRFNSSQSNYLAVGNPSTAGQSSLINTAGQYDSKSIFFVLTPSNPASTSYQTVYEQGGGSRGISVYIKEQRLYFQAWNVPNDDGSASPNLAPWGHQGGVYAIANSGQILQANETYIVSVHYQNNQLTNAPTEEGLRLYINGVKEGVYTGDVGRLFTHGGRTNIGCSENQSFYDDGPFNSNNPQRCFDGDIAEIIYFNEPNTTTITRMNVPRIQIIHNYLAAKYNITTSSSSLGANQFFDDAFSDASDASDAPNYFGNEMAGIGRENGESHVDSKGLTEMRISSVTWSGSDDGYLVWGHNGIELTDTWSYSSSATLPNGIEERSGRVWKFFESGADINTVQIEMDFSASDNADELVADKSVFKLLVSSHPTDFADATVYPAAVSQATGKVVRFNSISITDGMYVALGNTVQGPFLVLPIELLSFHAKLKGTFVDLNWSTATEINNDYFVVERASEDLDWTPILTVTGAGNSNSLLTYSSKDRDPLTGLSYYRLKQVDFDGGFSYSDPVSIFNNTIVDSEDVFMYPNPSSTGSVFLRLPFVIRDFETVVRLFDMSGKQIYSERFDTSSELFEFRYGELTPGIYLINIASDAINETKKLAIK